MAATNAAKAAAAKNAVVSDAIDIADDVKDIVEDSVELVKRQWVISNPKVMLLCAGLGGLVLGLSAGAFLMSKRAQKKWQNYADEQIESVKTEYKTLSKDGPEFDLENLASRYDTRADETDVIGLKDISPIVVSEEIVSSSTSKTNYNQIKPNADSVKDLVRDITSASGPGTPAVVEKTEVVESNVFAENRTDQTFNFAEQLEWRENNPGRPYVISNEEFDQNESDYDQWNYVYHEQDETLTDMQDNVITDPESVVGTDNLLRFGFGSNDAELVYVRNDKLQADIEITLVHTSYSKDVLGLGTEPETSLRHSARRGLRHFNE